jgi:large subunit ribosomal protein L25
VTIKVPVEAVGEPVGVKSGGGTLEHVLLKLRIRALPKDLPEQINVDVSGLEVGKSIHIGDIQAPEGVEILGDKHITVLAVAAPLTEAPAAADATAAAGAEAKQPEMIKEKKEEAPAAKAADKKK